VTALNVADEQLITKDGFAIRRYRVGGFGDATQDYDQLLRDLLASFAGSFFMVGATYKIYAGAPRPVEMQLVADTDLSGPIKVQWLRDAQARINEIHSLYPDLRNSYIDATSVTWPPQTLVGLGVGGGGGGGSDTVDLKMTYQFSDVWNAMRSGSTTAVTVPSATDPDPGVRLLGGNSSQNTSAAGMVTRAQFTPPFKIGWYYWPEQSNFAQIYIGRAKSPTDDLNSHLATNPSDAGLGPIFRGVRASYDTVDNQIRMRAVNSDAGPYPSVAFAGGLPGSKTITFPKHAWTYNEVSVNGDNTIDWRVVFPDGTEVSQGWNDNLIGSLVGTDPVNIILTNYALADGYVGRGILTKDSGEPGGGGGGGGSGSVSTELPAPVRVLSPTKAQLASTIANASPGDWICLNGTYSGGINVPANVDGTPDNPIVLIAATVVAGVLTENLMGATVNGDITIAGANWIIRSVHQIGGSLYLSGANCRGSRIWNDAPPALQDGIVCAGVGSSVDWASQSGCASVAIHLGAAATRATNWYVAARSSATGRSNSAIGMYAGNNPTNFQDWNYQSYIGKGRVDTYSIQQCVEVKSRNVVVDGVTVISPDTSAPCQIAVRHGAGTIIKGCYAGGGASIRVADADTKVVKCRVESPGQIRVGAGNMSPAQFFAGNGGAGNYPYAVNARLIMTQGVILVGHMNLNSTNSTKPPIGTSIEAEVSGGYTRQTGLDSSPKIAVLPTTDWTDFPDDPVQVSPGEIGVYAGFVQGSLDVSAVTGGGSAAGPGPSAVATPAAAWPTAGVFSLGTPDVNDFWTGHRDPTSQAALVQLPDGVRYVGGPQTGDESQNGIANWSRVMIEGDAEWSFKMTISSGAGPAANQADIGFRHYCYAQGRNDVGHPLYPSMFPVATQAWRTNYNTWLVGGVFRFFRMTQSDVNQTDPAYFATLNGTGSTLQMAASGPATEIDYSKDMEITVRIKRTGNTITERVTSNNQDLTFSYDASGLPTRGCFGFCCSAGIAVTLRQFTLISGKIISLGALLAFPGRAWPATPAFSYAFPDAGFTGWRQTTDPTITTPLANGWLPAPATMRDGFRRAFARIWADLGAPPPPEGTPSAADVLIAVSPNLRALGFNGYTFPYPSGALFLDDQLSGDDFAEGSYAFQVTMHEIFHSVGLVHPPLNSVLDNYGYTIMIRDSTNVAPWATHIRQADKDAVFVAANAVLNATVPDPVDSINPVDVTPPPWSDPGNSNLVLPSSVIGPVTELKPIPTTIILTRGPNPFRDMDGGVQLVRELRQPFVPYHEQVQRLQKAYLMMQRYEVTIDAAFLPSVAMLAEPMMVVAFFDRMMQIPNAKFMIGKYGRNSDGSRQMPMAATGDSIWDWSPAEEITENLDTTGGLTLTDDLEYTQVNTAITFDPLANDPNGDQLTVKRITTAANGTVDLADNGRDITYTPNTGYIGYETLTYTATDGTNQGDGTISIRVVAATGATAIDDFFTITDDSPHKLAVLNNDFPTAAAKTIVSRTTPGSGTATTNSDGTISYTRTPGFVGFDSFRYTMQANSVQSTARVNITSTGGGGGGGGGNGGATNSGLRWSSGWTSDNGDPDAAGAGGTSFGTWRGRGVDIVNCRCPRFGTLQDVYDYINGRNNSGGQYALAYNNNRRIEHVIPMVPSGESKGSRSSIFEAAAKGDYDAKHTNIANLLKGMNFVGKLIIRLAHECGSSSQADSYANDPSAGKKDFRDGWRRIALIYKNKIPGVLMDWNNIQHPPDPRPAYPGDDCVDIVSVDAYGQVLHTGDLMVSDADWNAYANKQNSGAPMGPRSWFVYAQSLGKKFGVAEWGLSPKVPGQPSCADSPRYIQGMWDLYNEAADAGMMEYDAFFNVKDGTVDHRIWYSGNPNPNASAKYKTLWTP
jgi:hypothetical protein